ncbi:unnamed protein product [Trifolium pratense]|uniref:Uncharacterized protein n=1 Tax=Trifolium pratense TaxID=57577 RepID=A0ACB0K4Y3_TRIPR|nr:unnamed protein product [Trifolium pratense]
MRYCILMIAADHITITLTFFAKVVHGGVLVAVPPLEYINGLIGMRETTARERYNSLAWIMREVEEIEKNCPRPACFSSLHNSEETEIGH